MRRFFLFAVLWAALFGPGHVLAACPMAGAAHGGSHAPCHSEGQPATPAADHGHDCCALMAPTSAAGKLFTQKSDGPPADAVTTAFATLALAAWTAPPLIRPPPRPLPQYAFHSAAAGSLTFLHTGRLRL